MVQALLSSPPSAGLLVLPVGLRFSFPLPFQGLPVPGQVCWCWCFLFPLFFCVPLLVFWLSNFSSHFHFHLTSISFSPSFSSHVRALVFYPTAVGCVCVKHLNRCKTSFCRGPMGTWMAWANEDPSKMLCKRTCTVSDNGMWLTQEPPRRISIHFQFFMLDSSYSWRYLELLSVL